MGDKVADKQLQELRNAVHRLKIEFRRATRDISKRGVQVPITTTHAGVEETKIGINPSLRVLRECQSAITRLQKQIAKLEAAQPVDGEKYAFLKDGQ